MNEVARAGLTPKERLDASDYLTALIRSARERNLIRDDFAARVQADLLAVLRDLCARYTRGDSDTVRTDTARALMEGARYAINLYLYERKTSDEAFEALFSLGVKGCHRAGRALIYQKVSATELFYLSMRKKRMDIDNAAYRDTLLPGIEGFFRKYDSDFFPQDTVITADYPVCLYPREKSGIVFIREYLQNWAREDAFCACFDQETVRRAYARYAKGSRADARELVVNLFLITLAQALLCALPAPYAEIPEEVFDAALTRVLRMPALSDAVRAYAHNAVAADRARVKQIMKILS